MQIDSILAPEPWRSAQHDLSEWVLAHLINRSDARGGYYRKGNEVRRTTRKESDPQWTPHDAALPLHFSAIGPRHIVGLHAISLENTSRWLVFDIDAHHGEDPVENLRIATELCDRLSELGLTAHIFDSDGRGGIHAWVIFDSPMPSAQVFAMGQRMMRGLSIETYPKQAGIPAEGFGNWIRLPGRHHSRDHWSRYWSGEHWLDARGTVHAILAMEPCSIKELPPVIRITRVARPQRRRSLRGAAPFTESPESLRAWLEDHGIVVSEVRPSNGAAILVLGACPFFDDHGADEGDSSVAVTWRPDGVGFRCFHNRCAGFGWKDLRARIDPAYASRSKRLPQSKQSRCPRTSICIATHATHATCTTGQSKTVTIGKRTIVGGGH